MNLTVKDFPDETAFELKLWAYKLRMGDYRELVIKILKEWVETEEEKSWNEPTGTAEADEVK